jgi:hypothetical protein
MYVGVHTQDSRGVSADWKNGALQKYRSRSGTRFKFPQRTFDALLRKTGVSDGTGRSIV